MKTLQEIKSGVVIGLSIIVTITLFGVAYAAVTYTELGGQISGNPLSADKWNKMYEHTNPPGAIIAFDLDNCPTGWTEYTPAYGRFLRGIDKSGTNIDPQGLREKGNIQEDMFKSHRHNLLQSQVLRASGGAGAAGSTGNAYNSDYEGGTETRPKNVAVLYCRKS